MITTHLRRILHMLCLAAAIVSIGACGGEDDDGDARIRVINATADADSIDLTIDNDDVDERRLVEAIARDGQSDYTGIDADAFTLRVKRAGASSTLAVASTGFGKDEHHTVFAYGREGDYRIYAAVDDEGEPSGGKAKVRVFNAAFDAGAVDVYLTEADAELDNTIATAANVAGSTMRSYSTIDRGTYRLRVTGANDKDDLRLDVAGIDAADGSRLTIVLQPGTGGVLVHALLSQYQGGLASAKNTFARARLVSGVNSNAAVTARLGSSSLNVNLRSPSVGGYALVPAGNQEASVQVNAGSALTGSVQLAAGGDYTLAVHGDPASPVWRLITDDNRLPAGADQARLRLLHMAEGVGANLTLVKDYLGVANDVAYGNVSSYALVAASTASATTRVEVTSPLSVTPLFLEDEVELPARSVFTVFMLGGATTPTGILRRER